MGDLTQEQIDAMMTPETPADEAVVEVEAVAEAEAVAEVEAEPVAEVEPEAVAEVEPEAVAPAVAPPSTISTDDVEYAPLAQFGAVAELPADLGRLARVPVELAVEIGRTSMTLGDALALGPGSIITLDRLAGDPVDLLVNGRRIALGEVVVIDEEFGLRITEITGDALGGAAADAADAA